MADLTVGPGAGAALLGVGDCGYVVTAIRTLAVVFALLWAVLGFGIVDLWVTVAPSAEWRPVALLDGGWGLLVTVLIAAGLALIAFRPQWTNDIVMQLLMIAGLFTVSGWLGDEPAVWWMVLSLLVQALVLGGLASALRRRGATRDARPETETADHVSLLGWLTALGAVPWLVYAADMYAANRALRAPTELTNNVNHWAIQGALAVALVLFAGLAALRPSLRRFNAVRVGICAVYFGLSSLRFPEVAAALPTVWAWLAIGWGVLIAAVAFLRRSPAGQSSDAAQAAASGRPSRQ